MSRYFKFLISAMAVALLCAANSAAFFAPEVFVHVDPAFPQMTVNPAGGMIRFTVEVGNEYPTIQWVDFWTNVVLPNGAISSPLIVRLNRGLAARDSFTVTINQWVPGNSPPGYYRYNVFMGDYPNTVCDLSYFYFQKLGSQDGGLADWPEAEVIWPNEICASSTPADVPSRRSLQASPNPFNAETVISLELPQRSNVRIELFNIRGQSLGVIYEGVQNAGWPRIRYRVPNQLASGMYFYRIELKGLERGGRFADVRKMLLLK